MYSDTHDMIEEIKKLREELNQMREIVNMLLNVVMDDSEDEEYETPVFHDEPGKRFNLYT